MSKPKVIKDYDKLDIAIQEQIKLEYPYGFEKKLIIFKNAKNELVSALPYETDEYYYLIRMTKAEARSIIAEDEDYDESGVLKGEVAEELSEKYDMDDMTGGDDDYMDEAEDIADDGNDMSEDF